MFFGIDYSKIKKGDKVYIASSDRRDKPYDSVVLSVGSKYITIDNGWKSKFDKQTGCMVDWSSWTLYPDKETYDNVQLNQEKRLAINRNLDYVLRWKATQEEIDNIYNIIQKYKK